MARIQNQKLINKLITEFTGCRKDDENFSISRQYVTSNLRFHRYLDVDSHKVDKSLEGLYEKFNIHSDMKTGEDLKQKVLQFLNMASFERGDVAKTSTHYAILAFLLEMSDRPTANGHLLPEQSTAHAAFDDFDWYKYLTEDLEPLQTQFSDSTLSDAEEDIFSADGDTCEVEEINVDLEAKVEMAQSSLRSMIAPRYWAVDCSSQLAMNPGLAHNWMSHLRDVGSLDCLQPQRYVTEYQAVREILWMLSGDAGGFLFQYDSNNGYSVRKGVNLSQTTKPALDDALNKFASTASKLSELRQFISQTRNSESALCRTSQAFAVACQQQIQALVKFCENLTVELTTGDASVSLTCLLRKLRDYRDLFDVLHQIYHTSVVVSLGAEQPSATAMATSFLSACNKAVIEANMASLSVFQVEALMKVYVKTLEPYLDIIDQWLTDGQLTDPFSEFVIKKKEASCLDETFWETALEVTSIEEDPVKPFALSSSVPGLLAGSLSKIVITGKSMEMLSQLGKLTLALGKRGRPLREVFVEGFCSHLSSDMPEDSTDPRESTEVGVDTALVKLESAPDVNRLLIANLRALFQEEHIEHPPDITENLRFPARLEAESMLNLDKAMSASLKYLVDERHRRVSNCLLTVLKDQCKLDVYLSMIRKVYLMEAGDVMSEFCNEMFDKMRYREQWKDSLSLNISLQECLSKQFPEHAVRFTLSLLESHRSELLPIHMLEDICITYMVDWPVDVVYTSQCEDKYSEVFKFILQVKLAKYCLQRVHFTDLRRRTELDEESGEEDELLVKRMCVLRTTLLHVVNGFDDYVMAMILHSSRLELAKKLSKAEDLEAVIKIHNSYVSQIFNRCFLHPQKRIQHDCILRLLNYALVFQRLWDEGLTSSTEKKLDNLSEGFYRSLQNLTSYVVVLMRTGSLPHLESLALSLRAARP